MAEVILLNLAMILMMGCEKREAPLLDREKARVVISHYLEDPRYDVKISVEMEGDSEDGTSLIADVVGQYQEKRIAVKYGKEFINAAPAVSPEIDYYIELPPSGKQLIETAMESLKDARFAPVLSDRKDLGTVAPYESIKASFRVRNASEGVCWIEDKSGFSRASFGLKRRSSQVLAIPDNSGLGLEEGEYAIVCSFSNVENLYLDDLLAARFSIPKYSVPKYNGGLKRLICSAGTEKSLDANFTSGGSKLDIVYYRDDYPMESNVFKCDDAGRYIVKAIATDENGVKAESPEVVIHVTFVPEENLRGYLEGGGYYDFD